MNKKECLENSLHLIELQEEKSTISEETTTTATTTTPSNQSLIPCLTQPEAGVPVKDTNPLPGKQHTTGGFVGRMFCL